VVKLRTVLGLAITAGILDLRFLGSPWKERVQSLHIKPPVSSQIIVSIPRSMSNSRRVWVLGFMEYFGC
jgi:hypothetical protein